MNIDPYEFLLILVIAWPLLLAMPLVHTRLPFAHYLVLLPAVMLVLFSAETATTPVWLLFGAGFELDNNNRWLLLMAIVIWFAAATTCCNARTMRVRDTSFSFFSLTLAGHLGTLLSADIVSFFSCSTLMGYGFYGLLLRQDNTAPNWAGRFYISFMIIADLLLFESILLAAHGAEQLQYGLLHKAIIDGNISIVYVWLVSIAFILKAGIWPAHIWLTTSFNSAPRPACILLSGVPVVMGLLGLIQWIPVGEMIVSESGIYFQMLGIITVLYVLKLLFSKDYQSMLPVLVTLFMTGLFVVGLGTVMARAESWHDYRYLVYPFLALLGIISAIICYTRRNQVQAGDTSLKLLIESGLRLLRTLQDIQLPSVSDLYGITIYKHGKSKQGDSKSEYHQRPMLVDDIEQYVRSWPVIITILAIFLLAIIFIALLS